MKLREIPIEIESRLDEYNAAETTDERRLEIEQELDTLDIAFDEKAASYADLLAHFEGECAMIKAEEQRLAAIRKRQERASEWLKRNLAEQMLAANKLQLQTDFWKFGFRPSTALLVHDANAVPAEYRVEVPATWTVDTAAVKKALTEAVGKPAPGVRGEVSLAEFPGVALEIRQNLQIK